MIEPIHSSNPTPGSLLRHQRQHIGWTVEEIANALCLSPELIRLLEADDYDDMGGSTFVLGYLRGYARLVGVDVEDAIVKHRDSIPEYVPDPDAVTSNSRSEKRSSRGSQSAGRWLVVLLVVGTLGVTAGYLLWPGQVVERPRVTDGLTLEDPVADGGATEATRQPLVRSDRLAAIDSATLREALDNDTALPMNLVLGDIDVPLPQQSSAQGQPAGMDDPRRHVVLMFEEGSWADVRDASGVRLLSQIVAEGSTVDLVGDPPFTVFLGNANGVRVQYMGRIQNFSQTEKGLFARFSVGQEQ